MESKLNVIPQILRVLRARLSSSFSGCSEFDMAEAFWVKRVELSSATWIWWRREVAPAFTNPLIRIFWDDNRGIRQLQLVAGVLVFFLSWNLLVSQSIDHGPE